MQVEREISDRIVVLTVRGDITDGDLMSLATHIQQLPDVGPEHSLLIDLREANSTGVTTAGVRALAGRPLVLPKTSRRAVVVPSDLGFGMARMYEMLAETRGGGARVFRDYGAALRWVETGV
jgi:hypothetical protein